MLSFQVMSLNMEIARVEDFGKEQQEHFRRVEATGQGICSKCRFTSGCNNCDVEKAWRYVVEWELRQRAAKLEALLKNFVRFCIDFCKGFIVVHRFDKISSTSFTCIS